MQASPIRVPLSVQSAAMPSPPTAPGTTTEPTFVKLPSAFTRIGRHFWQHPTIPLDADGWERLPDRLGISPEEATAAADLLTAVQTAIETVLTRRQREVLLAVVVHGVPLEALAIRRKTTRGALYKTFYDARRKLRSYLVTNHYLDDKRKEAK